MNEQQYDVIIVGGSYSGLAAGMALGRSLRNVLIIDSGLPCNRQTPYSHNFLTQDGKRPAEIATLAKLQVSMYSTVSFLDGLAVSGTRTENGFDITLASGDKVIAKKLIFATGVKDIMQDIDGYAQCWGISVLHCPYCHGYEVRNEPTGILANGDMAVEFAALIANWTKDLTVFTNGPSTLTAEQTAKLERHSIKIIEAEIEKLDHENGQLKHVLLKDGSRAFIKAMYARSPFEQHCAIPQSLGCELTEDGYIKVDMMQRTNVPGVYASGDNIARMRTVAAAVATGTMAGAAANKEMIDEAFN